MSGYGWMRAAACAGRDPDLWFPDATDTAAAAAAIEICRTCPVRAQCLDHALHLSLDHGIFAGTTREQRKYLRQLRGVKLDGGPEVLQPHGMMAAYKRHYRRGERLCEACATANRRHAAEYVTARRRSSSPVVPAAAG